MLGKQQLAYKSLTHCSTIDSSVPNLERATSHGDSQIASRIGIDAIEIKRKPARPVRGDRFGSELELAICAIENRACTALGLYAGLTASACVLSLVAGWLEVLHIAANCTAHIVHKVGRCTLSVLCQS